MGQLTLVIGNKNYSSWSLRAWLVLRQAGVEFEELRIPLYRPESRERVLPYSPTGLLPALRDGELRVWDSLAICEYLAERFPEKQLWPEDKGERAAARALAAEMHAGFPALRRELPMNCRLHMGHYPISEDVEADIARIREIWRGCLERSAARGPWLFGQFSIADAMYAPVALRFHSYGVELDGPEAAYRDHILRLPAIEEWMAEAVREADDLEGGEASDR
ncbi:glutathione S-transferase family protein [Alkalilimnicola sp. S0819]|uniref:glutathione S-transferase family protein n=1 Tax=Alkalilimnicola sp. S0819 TaxID=2613922 RepID=UPI001261D874|nr:glutathione S-transferase family protein [Alkalilimnicola sp. S0819]KAB7623669.1 glutathione S-transferase family protein [Alkalilimnicola sp. S0819]MPQ16793.1 glutathione S-transferase [Alkalilimnicola sp. S0819]